jgi:COX assembly mitochondrial protein 2
LWCYSLCEIQKALKRKANFERSKEFKEQLQAYKKEMAEKEGEL